MSTNHLSLIYYEHQEMTYMGAHRPLVPPRAGLVRAPACRQAGSPLREGGFSGESVRGPEPRGVQGLAPILQKL